MWILSITREIYDHDFKDPTILYVDNTGALVLAKNPEFHQKTKHIAIRERYIASLIQSGSVRVVYIPTSQMLADALTKPLNKDKHLLH